MTVYTNSRVLITGGLGFIGSNLALALHRLGAKVTIVDSLEKDCGANYFNISEIAHDVRVVTEDIGQVDSSLLREQDFVFNLAGEVSHPRSMSDPERDLRLNAVAHLRFLRTLAEVRRGIRVVYAGTRQVYGAIMQLPVAESHSTRPLDFNGVSKLAGEQFHTIMDRLGELDCVVLRLSNVYGPRMALAVHGQGFLVTYVERLVRGAGLDVFGDGTQLRDPVYVDDVVKAFLAAGALAPGRRKLFNIGGPDALALREIARIAAEAAGGATVRLRPFPGDRKPIDIGSFQADTRRARETLGWTPEITFADGMEQTMRYYRAHGLNYLTDAATPQVPASPALADAATVSIRASA